MREDIENGYIKAANLDFKLDLCDLLRMKLVIVWLGISNMDGSNLAEIRANVIFFVSTSHLPNHNFWSILHLG